MAGYLFLGWCQIYRWLSVSLTEIARECRVTRESGTTPMEGDCKQQNTCYNEYNHRGEDEHKSTAS